jgi:hypothetical protein
MNSKCSYLRNQFLDPKSLRSREVCGVGCAENGDW